MSVISSAPPGDSDSQPSLLVTLTAALSSLFQMRKPGHSVEEVSEVTQRVDVSSPRDTSLNLSESLICITATPSRLWAHLAGDGSMSISWNLVLKGTMLSGRQEKKGNLRSCL